MYLYMSDGISFFSNDDLDIHVKKSYVTNKLY